MGSAQMMKKQQTCVCRISRLRRLIIEQEQEKQQQVMPLKRVFEEETVGWRGFNETEGFVTLNGAILKGLYAASIQKTATFDREKAYMLWASKKPQHMLL